MHFSECNSIPVNEFGWGGCKSNKEQDRAANVSLNSDTAASSISFHTVDALWWTGPFTTAGRKLLSSTCSCHVGADRHTVSSIPYTLVSSHGSSFIFTDMRVVSISSSNSLQESKSKLKLCQKSLCSVDPCERHCLWVSHVPLYIHFLTLTQTDTNILINSWSSCLLTETLDTTSLYPWQPNGYN